MNQVQESGTHQRSQEDEPMPEVTELPVESNSNEGPAAAALPPTPHPTRDATQVLLGVGLVASFGAGVYVLYFVADPAMRMIFGLISLVSLMWTSSYLSIVNRVVRAVDDRRRLRRYPKLRSRVVQIVDEVKRMHWLAVDLDRGHRNGEAVHAEMEVIQRRLSELVESLPEVAGVERNDPARPRSADRLRESLT